EKTIRGLQIIGAREPPGRCTGLTQRDQLRYLRPRASPPFGVALRFVIMAIEPSPNGISAREVPADWYPSPVPGRCCALCGRCRERWLAAASLVAGLACIACSHVVRVMAGHWPARNPPECQRRGDREPGKGGRGRRLPRSFGAVLVTRTGRRELPARVG